MTFQSLDPGKNSLLLALSKIS